MGEKSKIEEGQLIAIAERGGDLDSEWLGQNWEEEDFPEPLTKDTEPTILEGKRVIEVDDWNMDSKGVEVDQYPGQIISVATLEEMGLVDGGTILDPWAVLRMQEAKRKELAEEKGERQVEESVASRKLWDFLCQEEECQHRFETWARDEMEMPCEKCGGTAVKQPASIASWSPSAERTAAQLRRRSYEHTMRTVRQGNSLKANETQRNTSDEWHSKTRSKTTRKGIVREKMNEWKDYAERPPLEFQPMGQPVVDEKGQAVYQKKSRRTL